MFELTTSSGTNLGLYPSQQEAKTQAEAFNALGLGDTAFVFPVSEESVRDDLPSRAFIYSRAPIHNS